MSFEVILGDLHQMQKSFETESDHIRGVRDKVEVDAVGTGNGELDRTLGEVLAKLATLHTHVVDVVDEHASKLRDTYDEYAMTEDGSYELFDRLLGIVEDQTPGEDGDSSDQ